MKDYFFRNFVLLSTVSHQSLSVFNSAIVDDVSENLISAKADLFQKITEQSNNENKKRKKREEKLNEKTEKTWKKKY